MGFANFSELKSAETFLRAREGLNNFFVQAAANGLSLEDKQIINVFSYIRVIDLQV